MSKAKALFELLEPRYRTAFEKSNGYPVHSLFFQKGFVFVQTQAGLSANHYRVADFQFMTTTLESRVQKAEMTKIS